MMARFCFVYFYFIFSVTFVAEIIQNSHLFSQENVFCLLVLFFPRPNSAWPLTFWLKYTMCCTIDTIEAVQDSVIRQST